MTYTIEGATGTWEIVCGLEVHAQVISTAKLFSGASTTYGGAPNSQVSPIDAGMPGMLPVVNRECIAQAVRTGLGLRARINKVSVFERKNYFYPDLPQGYQISQYQHPLVGEGTLYLDLPDGDSKPIGITRLHVEQDAGKSMHDAHDDATLIDLNRSGVALMEIVSEPDIRSPDEAVLYMRKLRTILRYLGTCDGNMEEGSLRCDANVSVRKAGETDFRTRCEIKNVNSMRFVARAIEYEAKRQIELYETGGTVEQETRLFDSQKGETRSMRSKEEAHDYRYFPDPDLLPLELDDAEIEEWRSALPELPEPVEPMQVSFEAMQRSPFGAIPALREAQESKPEYTGPKPDPDREPGPLEQFAVGSLKIVGTMNLPGKGWRAYVSAPDGVVYTVAPGEYMGQQYGRIEEIGPNGIVLRELVPRGEGRWERRKRTVEIKSTGG